MKKVIKYDNLGSRLVAVRKKKGFNQNSFAAILGISKPTLVRYENYNGQPTADFLSKLITLYNIDAHWLLTGEGEMFIRDKKILKLESDIYPVVRIKGDLDDPKVLKSIIEDFIRKIYPNIPEIDIDDFAQLILEMEVNIVRYELFIYNESHKEKDTGLQAVIKKFYENKKKLKKKRNKKNGV